MDVMVERYIKEVKKRVNADQRDGVEHDLLEAIKDREGQQLIDILSALGHPRDVAATYLKRQPYVISPAYYTAYRQTRKIVLYAVAMIVTIYAAIDAITGMTATTLPEALLDVFGSVLLSVFVGVVFAYGLVTLAFSWFESRRIRLHRSFNPKKMTELRCSSNACIDARKTLIELAMGASIYIFLFLAFTLYRNSIGWYDQGGMVASFYVTEALNLFTPMIVFGLLLMLAIDFYLLYKRSLTTLSAVLITIKYGYGLIALTLLLKLPNAINPRFIAYYAQEQRNVSYDDALLGISSATTIVLIIFVLVIGLRLSLLWLGIRRLQ